MSNIMKPQICKSKVLSKKYHTPDVVSLVVEKPKGFQFKAGQFAEILIPDPDNSKKLMKRSYSICSTPNEEKIEFCIKLIPEGKGSNFIENLKEGQDVELLGPFGNFLLPENEQSLIFIATGVGLSPIISLLKKALINLNYKSKVFLLFGVRSENDIFFDKQLDELRQKFSNFNYTLTLSRPSESWTGPKGRVTDYFSKILDKEAHYFICGNLNMVADTKKFLEDSGIQEDKIHFEMF